MTFLVLIYWMLLAYSSEATKTKHVERFQGIHSSLEMGRQGWERWYGNNPLSQVPGLKKDVGFFK